MSINYFYLSSQSVLDTKIYRNCIFRNKNGITNRQMGWMMMMPPTWFESLGFGDLLCYYMYRNQELENTKQTM